MTLTLDAYETECKRLKALDKALEVLSEDEEVAVPLGILIHARLDILARALAELALDYEANVTDSADRYRTADVWEALGKLPYVASTQERVKMLTGLHWRVGKLLEPKPVPPTDEPVPANVTNITAV